MSFSKIFDIIDLYEHITIINVMFDVDDRLITLTFVIKIEII